MLDAGVRHGSTMAYTASVDNSVESVTVTAMAADANAMVSGDGMHSLDVGDNTITVMVTAQDGTTMDYVVTVNRAEMEDPILEEHDANGNGRIDQDEAIAALRIYLAGNTDVVSQEEAREVIRRYLLQN